jgi:O-antigen ligase
MLVRTPAILSKLKSELPYPVEFCWLLGLVFFLPMFEAPKNLCWAGYVLAWLYNRARAREWGGRWDGWDSIILLWIASGYVGAAFAGIRHDEWSAANDVLRYGSVLWLVKRSRYGEPAVLAILGAAVAGTLLTLAWGYWQLLVAKTRLWLELNSVGYFNHSAIYVAIVFGAALGFALAYWPRMGTAGRTLSGVTALALVASVFASTSRTAVAAAVLFALAFALVFAVRSGRSVARALAGVIFGAALLLVVSPAILKKTEAQVEFGQPLSYREKIWSNGLIEWRRFPLFGVGMGNFGQVTFEQLQDWNKTHNWEIRPSAERMALEAPHGHSLYVNTLAERGLFGLGVLGLVLAAWGISVLAFTPRAADPPVRWTAFGGAFAAWFVTVAAGVLNTTLHHEHGILSVLLLGLWLGLRGARVS